MIKPGLPSTLFLSLFFLLTPKAQGEDPHWLKAYSDYYNDGTSLKKYSRNDLFISRAQNLKHRLTKFFDVIDHKNDIQAFQKKHKDKKEYEGFRSAFDSHNLRNFKYRVGDILRKLERSESKEQILTAQNELLVLEEQVSKASGLKLLDTLRNRGVIRSGVTSQYESRFDGGKEKATFDKARKALKMSFIPEQIEETMVTDTRDLSQKHSKK